MLDQRRWIIGFIGSLTLLICIGLILKIKIPSNAPAPITREKKITEPTIKITDPQRGSPDAPLSIIYFSDFGCDSCANASPEIDALLKDPQLAGKIRFVWKDFPAHKNIFPDSFELHKAGRCAAAAGHFWDFEHVAFTHIQEIHVKLPVIEKIITETGLDLATIENCMRSDGIISALEANEQEARALDVTATPTFFFGTQRIEGILPYYEFAGTIRSELARIEAKK